MLIKISTKSIALFDQGIVSGSNFVIIFLLAKLLGLDGFGYYSVLMMVVMFVCGIHYSFFGQSILSTKTEKLKEFNYVNSFIQLQLIISILLGIITFFMLVIFTDIIGVKLTKVSAASISLVVFVNASFDAMRRLFFASNNAWLACICDITNCTVKFIVVAFLFYKDINEIDRIIQLFAIATFIGLCQSILFSNFKPIANLKLMFHTLLYLWDTSKWLVFSVIVQWGAGNIFLILGAATYGPAVVGAIRVLQNIFGLVHVIILAMENFVPVNAVNILHNLSYNAFKKYLSKAIVVCFAVTSFFVIIFSIFNSKILMIYGNEYIEYLDIMMLYAFSYYFVILNGVLKIYYRTIKLTKLIFIVDCLSAILSVIIAPLLIKYMEVLGIGIGQILIVMIISIVYIGYKFFLEKTKNVNISSNPFI